MEGKRLEKVNKLLLKELGDIFQKELKPKVPSLMITVTRVNVTSDLSYARVYLSVFGVDEKKKVVEEVGQNAKAIRGLLGNRIRHQMRVVPELRFIEDDSQTTRSTTSKTSTICCILRSETAAVHSKPLPAGQKEPQSH